MIPTGIPFHEISIDPDVGERVVGVINHFISKSPDKSIDIQKVSEVVGFPGTIVKPVFYALLGLRLLKATFLPRHRVCGKIIGSQMRSVEQILDKAKNEGYFCIHCADLVVDQQSIEIQIIFWKPGTNVEE
ncbi:MAG: hypothetical protein JW725_02675 [Candidatus Babeliaceae bacterium]|nr:hypothetical protein [Candidatus Babeliaceae bacterium]